MNLSDNEIRTYLKKNLDMPCNELLIKETIQKSQKAFLGSEEAGTLSKMEFLLQQSKYVKKRWWIGQGLLLFICLLLQYANSNFYTQRMIGITAPLFVVLIIPEIWKNRNSNATEIESTAYYPLRQIYAARMLLFAFVDLILLSVFFCALLYCTRITATELIIQFFIPFNVTCCICFGTLYSPKKVSEVFSLLLCMVWCVVWVQIVLNEAVYNAISLPVWWILLAASFLYLAHYIKEGQKKCLEIWEVNPLWS